MLRRLAARLRSVDHAGRVLVGEDLAGNKFYEIGQDWSGRVRRTVEMANRDEYVYHEGELAAEWRSWLAGTRDDAPSREEQERAWAKQQQMRARVLEIEAREKEELRRQVGDAAYHEMLAEEEKRKKLGLVDHAAARSTESGKRVHSITRKGDDFQPQSWLPGPDAPADKAKTRAADKAYAPEEWDPENQSCVSVFGVGQCDGEPNRWPVG